ncbi:related to Pre-rRNA-processing ESF2 [Lecanosticta acicola]|uniref:18S rRNA factor 2 n=1 Tax=Lecanosticta acicola TaxID=111012 RepID=A0AAI8YXZ4_9PEZI|nr:related to Pre-rRNA-processing ESF2 [Lecanosticta acicola]
MSIRKRNEFLEGDDSDEEVDHGFESEEEQGRGAIGRHTHKRRKTESDSEASSGDNPGDEDAEGEGVKIAKASSFGDARFDISKFDKEDEIQDAPQDDDEDDERSDHDRIKPTKPIKNRAEKEAAKAQKAVRKSGVVYISRVPPFMKPQTLKHFLEPHARKGIGRIFLTPEDHVAHSKRVKSGGNKKKSFTDGWVEFNSKTEAKMAAETLNGNIIGGKKGNFYHDDLWNMKYLKGFKWHHLTEQIANENAERAARIREEIRRSRKENKAFVEDVERAKMLEGMESKKKAKRERERKSSVADDQASKSKQAREFKQRQARYQDGKTVDKGLVTSSGSALRKIF